MLDIYLFSGIFLMGLSLGSLIWGLKRTWRSIDKPAFLVKKEAAILEEKGYMNFLYPLFKFFGNLIDDLFSARKIQVYDDMMAFFQEKLKYSGYMGGLVPKEYLGAIVTVFLLSQIACTFYMLEFMDGIDWTVNLTFVFISILFPIIWLTEQQGERVKQINKKLPYTMNILVLCMEAGLDFISAVKISTEKNKQLNDPLNEEFKWMQNELEMGKTKTEALRNLSDKIPSDYVFSFVNSIIQAEKMGSPLTKVIRVQAESIGIKRMQKAEKKAGEAAVLILGPLLFIFVATFLVLFAHFIIKYFEEGSVV